MKVGEGEQRGKKELDEKEGVKEIMGEGKREAL